MSQCFHFFRSWNTWCYELFSLRGQVMRSLCGYKIVVFLRASWQIAFRRQAIAKFNYTILCNLKSSQKSEVWSWTSQEFLETKNGRGIVTYAYQDHVFHWFSIKPAAIVSMSFHFYPCPHLALFFQATALLSRTSRSSISGHFQKSWPSVSLLEARVWSV